MLNLQQAVVFAILMENGEGIIDKSPDYVLEKLNSAEHLAEPRMLLDFQNSVKFEKYQQRWIKTNNNK
jgi:hypothetical protein